MTVTAVDVYCGAGGASQGMVCAGIDVKGAYDRDDTALESYRDNIGNHATAKDIGDSQVPWIRVDWFHGSPPCQGFSRMGKRVSDDPRNLQVGYFIDWVAECMPKYVTIENVRDFLSTPEHYDAVDRLKGLGYNVNTVVMDAADYGVPQNRERVYILASTEGILHKPEPTHYKQGVNSLLGRNKKPWEQTRAYLDGIDEGVLISNQAKKLQLEGKTEIRTLDRPSYTVGKTVHIVVPQVTPKEIVGAGSLEPFADARNLTTGEMAALQTFPEGYRFAGSMMDKRKQIGNAVPPKLQEAVAREIINMEENQ